MKGDKVAQTQPSTPLWQQMASMNASYPSSLLQQAPMNYQNPYSMLSMAPQLNQNWMMGNSGLPNNGLASSNPQSLLSNLFGGANPIVTMQNPNWLSSLMPSPQQSALTPSQSLMQSYFGAGSAPTQSPNISSFFGIPSGGGSMSYGGGMPMNYSQQPAQEESQPTSSMSVGYVRN